MIASLWIKLFCDINGSIWGTKALVNEYKINDVIPIHNCPKGDHITLQ